jgi:transcriptional regulator with XRE-family HTH domain
MDRKTEHSAVGKAIARVRHERGMTQAGLAHAAGINPSTLALIETGKRGANVGTLLAIAQGLEVDAGELLPKADASLQAARSPSTAQRGLPLEDFEEAIGHLGLGALGDLGRELMREHREAIDARDYERAADLYHRRGILWERIQELDPPLCTITIRTDGPPSVTFYRDPSEEELAELKAKYGEFEVVRDLVPAV